MAGAYYNEIDPFAAAWLRELIKGGHVAAGEVDTRSIEDVRPEDLRGFEQCHFFAGIGGWSLALRRAGWPDDRPVWTGSCPCQPFSTAGQGTGFGDERHLWPAFYWLIQERRPAVIAGEQVASKDADPWLDLVQDDLEAVGYAFGAVAFPSAGVGAPHIRDRTYWMAYAKSKRRADGSPFQRSGRSISGEAEPIFGTGNRRAVGRMAQHDSYGRHTSAIAGLHYSEHHLESCSDIGGVDYTDQPGLEGQWRGHQAPGGRVAAARSVAASGESRIEPTTGPANGLWASADWLLCRDGKWRPVEPGTFPLAHGISARVGRLRGYGNAINAEQAALFVEVMQDLL